MSKTSHAASVPAGCGPEPPFTTIFLGKTGAGKSTTLSALTGLEWRADPVVACTDRPAAVVLGRETHPGLNRDAHRLVDLPGLGESRDADRLYLPWYREWAVEADRVLYLIQADTRAYKQDQIMLSVIAPLFKPGVELFIAVNQIDRLAGGPRGAWREPTAEQLGHLADRTADVTAAFADALGPDRPIRPDRVIAFAAGPGWGLNRVRELFFHA